MEKRLIKKVEEHELLYKVDHALYRDRVMRASAWNEIGKNLGSSAQQCKEMWRKLRNCYLNAINRRQHKNIPKWKYESEMSFLLPYLDISNRSLQTELEQHVSASYSDGGGSEVAASVVYEDPSPPPHTPEAILPETSGLVSTHGRRPFPDLETEESYMRRTSRDETELFFLSISETVKRLRPVDQARIKKQLCNAVYEAEIRMLEEDEEEMKEQ